MDHLHIRRISSMVDLEIGSNFSPDDEESSGEKAEKKLDRLRWSGSVSSTGMISDDSSSSNDNNVKAMVREGGKEVKNSKDSVIVKEKRLKGNAKPPRPPRGPFLDAADMKWLREITELARLKRARIQRMKALKKRAKMATSYSNSIFPMVVTVVFFCIIIFHGFLTSRV